MTEKKTMAPRDVVLLIAMLLMLTSTLYWLINVIIQIVDHSAGLYSQAVNSIIRIILGLIPLGLAFTMRSLALKITAFSIAGIYLVIIILQIAFVI